MTMNLVIVTAIPVALLFLLLVAARRDVRQSPRVGAGLPRESDYFVRLPETRLLEQCFSPEDVEFAAGAKIPALLRLLVHERRRLALAWLRETRREATRLYSLHVRSVRHAADLQPTVEIKLLSAVALFLIIYGVMLATVWFYGPLRTRRFLHSAHVMADLLSQLSGRIAAGAIAPVPVPQMAGGR